MSWDASTASSPGNQTLFRAEDVTDTNPHSTEEMLFLKYQSKI